MGTAGESHRPGGQKGCLGSEWLDEGQIGVHSATPLSAPIAVTVNHRIFAWVSSWQ